MANRYTLQYSAFHSIGIFDYIDVAMAFQNRWSESLIRLDLNDPNTSYFKKCRFKQKLLHRQDTIDANQNKHKYQIVDLERVLQSFDVTVHIYNIVCGLPLL